MLNIDFEGLCPFVNYISKVRINYIDATVVHWCASVLRELFNIAHSLIFWVNF